MAGTCGKQREPVRQSRCGNDREYEKRANELGRNLNFGRFYSARSSMHYSWSDPESTACPPLIRMLW